MDRPAAVKLIRDTFENSFDKGHFVNLSKNLFKHLDVSGNFLWAGNRLPNAGAFQPYIDSIERIGKSDAQSKSEDQIDVLIVNLKKETSLERARTRQRNFVGRYLEDKQRTAALVAFVPPNPANWRFSLVRMDYNIAQSPTGRVKVEKELTPARRYSFLVGESESSHTAQVQLLPILENDERKPLLSDFEKAFSIEVVTKEFFTKYRELFHKVEEALRELVGQNERIRDNFEAKGVDTVNFAKKLLGQVVFLYFLQKKGWFGVSRDEDWGTGPKDFLRRLFENKVVQYGNFFNDILEPLFYEALAVERTDDFYSRFNCKIPFLNGGLFDPINNYDWIHTDILLDNELFSNTERTKEGDIGTGILDVFDRYNFTVKEDEPLDKEVAVDPEMLGKVFENLLEVKDRKSKGTYYTPREIVHYMCQESLINYLDTAINTGEVPLVATPPPQGKLFGKPNPKQEALKAPGYRVIVPREDIEALVLMGELAIEHDTRVESHGKETERYSYKLPGSIRWNAKLIDDKLADIRVCDPAIGSGAFPVGLMTGIVRARNTLTTYLPDKEGRSNYHFKRHAIQNCLYGVDIDPGAVEIAKLRLWLSLVVDEEDIKQIQPLPNLDYKIVYGNSLLGVEKDLFNVELFNELEKLKPLYFNETNVKKKQEHKKQIDQLIRQITNDNETFDFEVYFSEVFHGKGGFDVVIANPPYVEARGIQQEQVDTYRRLFKTAGNRVNTFAFFVEKGIGLLNNERILSFIIHRNSIRSNDYRNLRKFILDNTKIKDILSFKIGVFEEVTGEMVVLLLQKSKNNSGNTINVAFLNNTLTQDFDYKLLEQDVFNNLPDYRFNIYLNRSRIQVLDKMNKHHSLKEFADVKQGIIVGNEKKYIKAYQQSSKYKPILRGKNISRYKVNFHGEYLYYVPGTRVLTRGKTKDLFEVPEKILTQHVSSKIVAALDTDNYYYLQTINGITSKRETIANKYLLALLNSALMNFFYEYTFNIGAEFTTAVAIENLNKLPIKEMPPSEQQSFIDIVDQILAITKDEDYLSNPSKQAKVKELERHIDQMVYELYGLTPEEIAMVEESQ
jgi:hypothetical protein